MQFEEEKEIKESAEAPLHNITHVNLFQSGVSKVRKKRFRKIRESLLLSNNTHEYLSNKTAFFAKDEFIETKFNVRKLIKRRFSNATSKSRKSTAAYRSNNSKIEFIPSTPHNTTQFLTSNYLKERTNSINCLISEFNSYAIDEFILDDASVDDLCVTGGTMKGIINSEYLEALLDETNYSTNENSRTNSFELSDEFNSLTSFNENFQINIENNIDFPA